MELIKLETYNKDFQVPRVWLQTQIFLRDQTMTIEYFMSDYTYEDAHKIYQKALVEGFVIAEQIECPLCESGRMNHKEHEGTHIYICDECPNVSFEYHSKENTEKVLEYLK